MGNYGDILKTLYSINDSKGMKLGLNNVVKLNQLLGNPVGNFPVVHVAGTNGKGSVCTKIAKGLESKFSKVGVYTSPHISSYRERISVNRQMISQEDVQQILPQIVAVADKEKIPATFFELSTLLAFKYFANKKIDIAVIETGLGGRLDATNITLPVLSIITSIDFDHTELLGNTLESIAYEKGGIIKPGIPVILGPTAHFVPIKEGCPVIRVQGTYADVDHENRAIAKAALEYLHVGDRAIIKALTTRLPCRRERIHFQGKEVILDVAHNPRGLECLFQELKIPYGNHRVVCGLSKTKDLEKCLQAIHSAAQNIHLVEAPNGRGATPEHLQNILLSQGVSQNRIVIHSSVAESLSTAFATAATDNQELTICGTFFIMSEARQFLGIDEPRDPIDLNEKMK